MKPSRRRRGLLSVIAVLPLIAMAWLGAAPAAADPAPTPADAAPARPATSYSADPLPTAQMSMSVSRPASRIVRAKASLP